MTKLFLSVVALALLASATGCQSPSSAGAPHTSGADTAYRMSDADFHAKYGMHMSAVPRAPAFARATTAPILPYAVRQAGRGGWIEFALHFDAAHKVTAVEVVGYSERGMVVPASIDSMKQWLLRPQSPSGLYLVRAKFSIVDPVFADVHFE